MTVIRNHEPGGTGSGAGLGGGRGMDPGRCDAVPFHAADPTGFLIAEADDGELAGEPAAAISVVRYGDSFGFLGLYIVRPEYRGRGLGMAVWKAGMDVSERPHGRAGRRGGPAGQLPQIGVRAGTQERPVPGRRPVSSSTEPGCWPVGVPFDRLLAYDLPCSERQGGVPVGLDRHAGRDRPGGGRHEGLRGRAALRGGLEDRPLFADDEATAEALFLGICARLPTDGPVILDVPEPNRTAMRMAERAGLTQVFETAHVRRPGAQHRPEPHLRHHVVRTGVSRCFH